MFPRDSISNDIKLKSFNLALKVMKDCKLQYWNRAYKVNLSDSQKECQKRR